MKGKLYPWAYPAKPIELPQTYKAPSLAVASRGEQKTAPKLRNSPPSPTSVWHHLEQFEEYKKPVEEGLKLCGWLHERLAADQDFKGPAAAAEIEVVSQMRSDLASGRDTPWLNNALPFLSKLYATDDLFSAEGERLRLFLLGQVLTKSTPTAATAALSAATAAPPKPAKPAPLSYAQAAAAKLPAPAESPLKVIEQIASDLGWTALTNKSVEPGALAVWELLARAEAAGGVTQNTAALALQARAALLADDHARLRLLLAQLVICHH